MTRRSERFSTAVDPRKAFRVVVPAEKIRFRAVQMIQRPLECKEAAVLRAFQQIPVELAILIPFARLRR